MYKRGRARYGNKQRVEEMKYLINHIKTVHANQTLMCAIFSNLNRHNMESFDYSSVFQTTSNTQYRREI